jgi:4-diphosphocytidyl-2-C-methyl-D-erythritol kinase
VRQKRADHFHNIESVFLALPLFDTLNVRVADIGSFSMRVDALPPDLQRVMLPPALPPEKNLVAMALDVFRHRTNIQTPLALTLTKRIPPGGGLGGGSSDAAAALIVFNTVLGANLPHSDLVDMACELGSDVPFFLEPGAAWVTGRGEHLSPIAAPTGLAFLLVNPLFPSDTSAAYKRLDAARALSSQRTQTGVNAEVAAQMLTQPPATWPFFNSFTEVLSSDEGIYSQMLATLTQSGAEFIGISGSGSTCFGVFTSPQAALKAKSLLPTHFWSRVLWI